MTVSLTAAQMAAQLAEDSRFSAGARLTSFIAQLHPRLDQNSDGVVSAPEYRRRADAVLSTQPQTRRVLDAAFAGSATPTRSPSGHAATIAALNEVQQVDGLSDTGADWHRCGSQVAIALTVLAGPEPFRRFMEAIPRVGGGFEEIYDQIMDHYRDGALSSQSLERLGYYLYSGVGRERRIEASRRAGFHMASGGPQSLAPGEGVRLWGIGKIHITGLARVGDRYVHYDSLRSNAIRYLTEAQAERLMRRSTVREYWQPRA